jgi:type I restriction enzyme, S subunit
VSLPFVALAEAAMIDRAGISPRHIVAGTTYVGLENIDGLGNFIGVVGVEPGELASNKFQFTKDQVLFGKLRPYLKKTARPSFDGVCSTDILPLSPAKHVDRDYLFHVLRRQSFVDEVTSLCAGANLPRISPSVLGAMQIPLPPLPEQRRIAAILDKADTLCVKRREAIAKLDQLLHSVFLKMFGNPVTNSKALPMVALEEIGEWSSGGTPARSNGANFQGEIPWYSSGELNSVYVDKSDECISPEALKSSSAKLMKPGSLMLGMYDTAAFKSSITTESAACNQAIAFAFLDSKKCETLYVYEALQIGKDHFKRMQRGVRQKNLNLSMIRDTQIALPSLSAQKKFSSVFKAVYEKIESHKYSGAVLDELYNALQMQFFTGDESRTK